MDMRKTAAALILALLFSAAIGTMLVKLATANPTWSTDFPREPDKTPPTITLHSPLQNQTCNSTNILLNFTVAKPETWFKVLESSNPENYTWALGNVTSVSYEVAEAKNKASPFTTHLILMQHIRAEH